MKISKFVSITLIYLFIALSGIWSFYFVPVESMIVKFLVADLVMTVITFLFSLWKRNSSVYDAYWSVIPFYFVVGWICLFGSSFTYLHWMMVFVISFWSWRLTLNWFRSWPGWAHEDWRYVDFRNSLGKHFQWMNFFGIHLYPTLIVFLSCSGLFWFFNPSAPITTGLAITGGVIAFIGALFEFFADNTLYAYRNRKDKIPGGVLREGLWKYTRHPNYLGEMLFWIGVALAGLSAGAPLWTILGAVGMVAMFLFASIPMKENRMLASRPEAFKKYQEEVSKLIPLPPK
jgi:steroid 5-alpha reductase family enzyme